MPAERQGRVAPVRALIPVVAALVLLGLWWAGREEADGLLGFRLDDAWIHMVYGREIALHGYPAYNPETPATGATSPLWTYLLGGLHLLLGPDRTDTLVRATHFINGAFCLLVVGIGMRVARQLGGRNVAVLAAGWCLAFATPVAAAAYSGMEVNLAAVLLVLALSLLLDRRALAAGAAFALACLTRPEAAICALLGVVWLAVFPCVEGPVDARAPGRRREQLRLLLRFLAPLVAAGIASVTFNTIATGRLLPATFYMKAKPWALGMGDTLKRLFGDLFGQVPTLAGGAAWLAMLAFLLGRRWPGRGATALALGMGLSYAMANAILIPPSDPAAFYHLRYVLPPVPLLIVGLLVAAEKVVPAARGWLQWLFPVGLAFVTTMIGMSSITPLSRHLHSDTRNINEVQRRLGLWLRGRLPETAWIASNDAGAIRYFSQRRTVDLMGLNTPELVWCPDRFEREHPVSALVFMPDWFRLTGRSEVKIVAQASTLGYTVTSFARMAIQQVVGCVRDDGAPVSVHLAGVRKVNLTCTPMLW